MHRDLAAIAGLAGHGLDLHQTLGDLVDLALEKLHDEIRMVARDIEAGAGVAVVDLDEQGGKMIALLILFAGELVLEAHGALGLSEIDDDLVALDLSHHPVKQLVELILVKLADIALFSLPKPLRDHLPGGLSRNATEIARGYLPLKLIANSNRGKF